MLFSTKKTNRILIIKSFYVIIIWIMVVNFIIFILVDPMQHHPKREREERRHHSKEGSGEATPRQRRRESITAPKKKGTGVKLPGWGQGWRSFLGLGGGLPQEGRPTATPAGKEQEEGNGSTTRKEEEGFDLSEA